MQRLASPQEAAGGRRGALVSIPRRWRGQKRKARHDLEEDPNPSALEICQINSGFWTVGMGYRMPVQLI
jgi:hypothetical protein